MRGGRELVSGETVLALFWLVAKILLLLSGLLLPGAALARALRLPPTLPTCFAGSAVSLYATVLALQFASIRITLLSLGSGLLAIAVTAFGLARLVGHNAESRPIPEPPQSARRRLPEWCMRMGGWTPLYLLFWLLVLWRAGHEPLAGPDVEFRWSFLAEQMLRLGSLDFYPPRSAEDFETYFWAESIPPGASVLHAWAYACAGGPEAAWTIPAVVLQLFSLHGLLWLTAERLGGVTAARLACVAAAACPLLTWSVLLSQETGLTAVSLVGIAYATHSWRETRQPGWTALAGIFAVLGASAREYGLVFPILALVSLIAVRADRRAWLGFLVVSAISVIWPLRTWVLTGNPFYSLPLGTFPVNERFVAWIEHDAEAFGAVLHSVTGWGELARYFLLCAPAALLGWFALVWGTARACRPAILGVMACIAVLALWVSSVRYTNGGAFYSLRVTSPALALGALALGLAFAAVAARKPDSRFLLRAVMAFLFAATLPATLALPRNPWRTPPADWPAFSARADLPNAKDDPTVALIANALATSSASLAGSVVLADSPGYQRRFLPLGVRVIPLWSPQADWLFDPRLSVTDAAHRWRESQVRHLILTNWQANLDFFNTHARWAQPPFQVQVVGQTALTTIFAIRAVE